MPLSLGIFGLAFGRQGRSIGTFLPQATTLQALIPGTEEPVDIFNLDSARTLEYRRRWRYYEGEQYTAEAIEDRDKERQRRQGGAGSSQVQGLYNFMRNFYNVVPRVVNADVASVFRDPVQFQPKDARKRSAKSSTRAEKQLDRLVRVSHLNTDRYNIVRYGAVAGDVYLRVGRDSESGLARIFIHPADVVRVEPDPFDRNKIAYAIISYPYRDVKTGNQYLRTDLLWPDEIQTFRDGELFGFDGNDARQENPLGRVPIVHIKNIDVGTVYGLPSYGDVLPTIDGVNEVLSFLTSILKINADPIILAYGINAGGLRKGHQTDMQGTVVWHIPVAREGVTKVEMMEWKGNLPDMIAMLQHILSQVEDSQPELHMSRMQKAGTMSGFALNSMMFPFVDKITVSRVGYRGGLSEALSMGLAYQDMLDGRVSVFDPLDDRYDVDIVLPPVLPINADEVLNRAIALLEARLIGRDEALRMQGYPEDMIAEILASADASWQHLQGIAAAASTMQESLTNQQTRVGGQGRKTPADRAQDAVNGQPINQQLNAPRGNG